MVDTKDKQNAREISLARAGVLSAQVSDYQKSKAEMEIGRDESSVLRYEKQKKKLLAQLNASTEDWDNWKWQMKNRITQADDLAKILPLSQKQREDLAKIGEEYRFAITPYYLALIDPDDPHDPIYAMSIPQAQELEGLGEEDPMAEEFTNPAGIITRRYPDRLILNVTNACAMFCRHCQRRRRIGGEDLDVSREALEESFRYIRENPEIRDVLITGGDSLALTNEQLRYILSSLRAIPSVEIIRLGTRTLVTMPMRFDREFLEMVEEFHPVYLNTHFNHPRELTPEVFQATNALCRAGVPLGNQMVLLNGVNNDKHVVMRLNHELSRARIRPYYIFHAKAVRGATHFCTTIDEGLAIMEYLRGRTSGLSIPTYIVNAPGGLGKIPLLPNYIHEYKDESIVLQTWEGNFVEYPNVKFGDEKKLAP